MRTCERHPRTVVVYEVGLGECPMCKLADANESFETTLASQRDTIVELEEKVAGFENNA